MSMYLEHHGIAGQKWGVRKYQNEDGSLTPAGRERYNAGKYGGRISKSGKYVASNGQVVARSKSAGISAMRRFSTTLPGAALSSMGTGAMSRLTGRSKESLKAQIKRERDALREYYKVGGDKMLKSYAKDPSSVGTHKVTKKNSGASTKKVSSIIEKNHSKKVTEVSPKHTEKGKSILQKIYDEEMNGLADMGNYAGLLGRYARSKGYGTKK